MVAEVIGSNPDVVYAIPPSPPLFKAQTDKVPLVALTGDPVAAGLVQSLARPGGNLTGVSVDTGPTIHGKRIALLCEIFPALSKLCCLTWRTHWENLLGLPMRAACDAAGPPFVTSLIYLPRSDGAFSESGAHWSPAGAKRVMDGGKPGTLWN